MPWLRGPTPRIWPIQAVSRRSFEPKSVHYVYDVRQCLSSTCSSSQLGCCGHRLGQSKHVESRITAPVRALCGTALAGTSIALQRCRDRSGVLPRTIAADPAPTSRSWSHVRVFRVGRELNWQENPNLIRFRALDNRLRREKQKEYTLKVKQHPPATPIHTFSPKSREAKPQKYRAISGSLSDVPLKPHTNSYLRATRIMVCRIVMLMCCKRFWALQRGKPFCLEP